MILDSDFGGPRDQKVFEMGLTGGRAEAVGNQFLAELSSTSHTPGALPKAGAADLRRLRRVPAAALEA